MKVTLTPFTDNKQITDKGLSIADVYQTVDFNKIESGLIDGAPYLMLIELDNLLMAIPVIKRKTPSTSNSNTEYYDLTSAYGYPGYIANMAFNSEMADKIKDAIIQATVPENIVSIFLRLNPITNNTTWPQADGLMQVTHGKTIFIDLTSTLDDIKIEYGNNHKRDLKKIKQSNFSVAINNFSHFNDFVSAYTETMENVNANDYYFFNDTYFNALKHFSETQLHLLTAQNEEGEVTAGALFFETNGIVQYHLGGTKTAFRHLASSKLIFDQAIDYFKSRGNKILHLGGGYGAKEDALFRFKSGFSNYTLAFSTLRIVTMPKQYELLSTATGNSAQLIEDFFPAYRKINNE